MLALLLSTALLDSRPMVTVLSDVSIVDARSAKPIEHQTVVIEGNRIKWVGDARKADAPLIARRYSGTGKYLIPGLWDMHVHAFITPAEPAAFLPLYIANGVTGIRDMGGSLRDVLTARDLIMSSSLVGPRIVAAGPPVDGPSPVWPGSLSIRTPQDAIQAVGQLKEEGADFIKVYSFLQRDGYNTLAAAAKRQRMVFAGHVPEGLAVLEAIEAGQRSIEHLDIAALQASPDWQRFLKEREVAASSKNPTEALMALAPAHQEQYLATFNPQMLREVARQIARTSAWITPTTVVADTFYGEWPDDPRLRYMPADVVARWSQPDFRLTPDRQKSHEAGRHISQVILSTLNQEGVKLLIGSDTASVNRYTFPGWSLHGELIHFTEAGMSPHRVLATATLGAARYLGKERDLGTVEEGKLADLVLLDANPLEDIANVGQIQIVIADGRVYDRTAVDYMLQSLAAKTSGIKTRRGAGR